ncbi:MAG: hypothetical protein R3Y38_02095 [Rikenellaceae bacterium]
MLNNTFIISGSINWDLNNPSEAQKLAHEISKHHKVLYINPPTELVPLLGEHHAIKTTQNKALKSLNKNLWILNPPMINHRDESKPPFGMYHYIDRLSLGHYCRIINWAINNLSLRNSILIDDNDLIRNFYTNEYLNPWLSIFFYHQPKALNLPYRKLFSRSNIIITPSQNLCEKIRGYNFNTFNIGYGVDYKNQRSTLLSREMLGHIPHPRIGLVSPVDSRELSVDLVYKTALEFSDCSIILVGEMDEKFSSHPLCKLSNVFIFNELIYNHISQMDICINPQHYYSLNQNAQKEQILRYLYMGKSVVSTTSLSAGDLAPYIYLGSSDAHFLELIRASLNEKLSERTINARIKFAQNMSVKNCTDRLFSIIDMFESELRESYSKINSRKSLV